jgi:hypothetical protein
MGEDMPVWGARIDGDMRYISVVGQPDGGWFGVEMTLPIRGLGSVTRRIISPYYYNPDFKPIGINATLDRGRIIGGQDSHISLNPYAAAMQWAINYMQKHPGGEI